MQNSQAGQGQHALLREPERARKNLADLATSPLCALARRSLPAYIAAAERARADLVKSMQALGIIRD